MESITLDREVVRLRDSLGVKFAENIYYGFWFAPEFDLMRKLIDEMQQPVTGDVRLKLVSRQRDCRRTAIAEFALRRAHRDV